MIAGLTLSANGNVTYNKLVLQHHYELFINNIGSIFEPVILVQLQ